MSGGGTWDEALPLSSGDSDLDSKNDDGVGSTKPRSESMVIHSEKDLMSEVMVEVDTITRSRRSLHPEEPLKCPRCNSVNTKFCYYNNNNLSQPRHLCKCCRRYWTIGGIIRGIPIGGTSRKCKLTEQQHFSKTPRLAKPATDSNSCVNLPLNQPLVQQNSNPIVKFGQLTKQQHFSKTPRPVKSASDSNSCANLPLNQPLVQQNSNPTGQFGSFTSLMTTLNLASLEHNVRNVAAVKQPLDFQQQELKGVTFGEMEMKKLIADLKEQTISIGLGEVQQTNSDVTTLDQRNNSSQGVFDRSGPLVRRAEMYQEYMKQIPIPTHRGSLIPFSTWQGLAKSLKELYGQPLHYLTNILLKQWDESRIGADDEHKPLDSIIHPSKAEAAIWLMEEAHRLTSSYHHLATLWASDPMHHAFVDPIFHRLKAHCTEISYAWI